MKKAEEDLIKMKKMQQSQASASVAVNGVDGEVEAVAESDVSDLIYDKVTQ